MKSKRLNGLMELHGDSIEEMENRHPGFNFRHSSGEEDLYEKRDGSELLIEVKGRVKFYDDFCRQDTIAILGGDEAIAYQILQWNDSWRTHPDVAIPTIFKTVITIILLTLAQAGLIALKYGIAGFLYAVIPFFFFSIFEFNIFLLIKNWLRTKRGMRKLYAFIKNTPQYNREHYQALFEKLSHCNCHDKRLAAEMMAEFLSKKRARH